MPPKSSSPDGEIEYCIVYPNGSSESIKLKLMEGSKFIDYMKLAADRDPKFR